MPAIEATKPFYAVHDVESEAPSASAAPNADAVSVLPEPDASAGDPVAMLAKLFVKSSQQKRESQEVTAQAEEVAEDAADARRLDAMQTKTEETYMAGMIGGLSQIGSGACSLVGGFSAAADLKPGGGGEALSKSTSSKWDGAGGLGAGVGKLGEAQYKKAADSADEAIAKAESQGKVAKRAQDELRRQVDAASQHEGKVMQLLQEIKQAQAQCERAALLRM